MIGASSRRAAPLLAAVVLALIAAAWVRARTRALAAWRDVSGQVTAIHRSVRAGQLTAVDGEETALAVAIGRMRRHAWFAAARARPARQALGELGARMRAVHAAADVVQQHAAEERLAEADRAFADLERLLPADFRAAAAAAPSPRTYACPMHPEVVTPAPGTCPTCGMPLAPRERGSEGERLTLVLQPTEPLREGQRASIAFVLKREDGRLVTSEDLIEVHTKRLHLLIVESTLTDYHHEHPLDAGRPGLFTFDFVPRGPGPYRMWADVLPAFTGAQEYVVADLPSAAPHLGLQERETRLRTRADGLEYELAAPPQLTLGKPATLRLTIRDGDGQVVSNLEPVMAAFAHLVGFNEDWRTISHVHPSGGIISDPTQRGRGELTFILAPPARGTMVLFAQVQIEGAARFARFVLPVVD